MNLNQINPECFILALFIRDDGERFLLGSGAYIFKDSQQQFIANTYANDIVEVQGNDGVFLAGQVRRPSTQSFDGYIGDATVSKEDIEEYRKDFLAFFRKNYYYKVIYVFPNGEAIQRRKGFIVDAPEAKELFQIHPEYHIALNFEDINYYSYSEGPDGQEVYTKSASISLSTGASSGGLVWDNLGAVCIAGKNLITFNELGTIIGNGITVTPNGSQLVMNGTTTASANIITPRTLGFSLPAGDYTLSVTTLGGTISGSGTAAFYLKSSSATGLSNVIVSRNTGNLDEPIGFTLAEATTVYFEIYCNVAGKGFNNVSLGFQVESGSTATTYEPYMNDTAPGFVWEDSSGAGPTTVLVDSIDRVYPIWELTGPAVNPQLDVLTTGTAIRYSGTVTASQTLVVDMFNKTAKLNGASVIGNVSGDWAYFTAGNNRVVYTTNNADANLSTIYWQEVVG